MNPKKDQRKSARVRVRQLSLTFHDRPCKIFNISERGVAFSINAPREVKIGKEMDTMLLNHEDPIEITGFARHISHISEIEPEADVRAEWVCGAEFTTHKKPELKKRIKNFIESAT
ncbi:MAG: hypothetical protein ABIK15_03665 [Pseudomonadota bacterium]